MPRPALTHNQRSQIRRKIRDAAAQLYTHNGVSNVSVRAVAEVAGVSIGTVYTYFGSLSELLQSLWRQPAQRLVTKLVQLAQERPAADERLGALLHAYVDFALEEPLVFQSAFLFVRPTAAKPPPQIDLAEDKFFQVFKEAIRAGQQTGVFRSGDRDKLTQMVLGSVHGALAMPINMHRLALDASDQIPRQVIDAQLEWLQSDK